MKPQMPMAFLNTGIAGERFAGMNKKLKARY